MDRETRHLVRNFRASQPEVRAEIIKELLQSDENILKELFKNKDVVESRPIFENLLDQRFSGEDSELAISNSGNNS